MNNPLMPPSEETITSDELWTQIASATRPHRLVPFPRKGEDGKPIGHLAMFVLSQEESEKAIASAEAWVRKILKEQKSLPGAGEPRTGYEELLDSRKSVELLFRACYQPEKLDKKFFPAMESIAQKLTMDEVAILILNYRRVQMELGPVDSEMGPEERDAWIEKLAKGGSSFPLDYLSMGALTQLITYMASRLWTSQTPNSTPGSQPDASI